MVKPRYSHRDFGRVFAVTILVSFGLPCFLSGFVLLLLGGWVMAVAGIACLLAALYFTVENESPSSGETLAGTPNLIRCRRCTRLTSKTAGKCFCGAPVAEDDPPARLTAEDIQFLSQHTVQLAPSRPQLTGPLLALFFATVLAHYAMAPQLAGVAWPYGYYTFVYPTTFILNLGKSDLMEPILQLFVVPVTSAYVYGYLALGCCWLFLWLRSTFEPERSLSETPR